MSENPQKLLDQKLPIAPIWAVSAKIVEERPYGPSGQEIRRGTGKFNANQKVYVCDVFWGPGGEVSTVIGRYRGKHKYITLSLKTRFLTRFRAELIYSPTVIQHIHDIYEITPEVIKSHWLPLDGSEISQKKAQWAAERMNETADYWRGEKLKHIEEQPSKK